MVNPDEQRVAEELAKALQGPPLPPPPPPPPPGCVAQIIQIVGSCQYGGCVLPAVELAAGRLCHDEPETGHPVPGVYCERHARIVSVERDPEYTVYCPNCGCKFGV